MGYDSTVAGRIRRAMARYPDVVEHRMFGGLAFMLGGHMCCGVIGDTLMVRVGPQAYAAALARPHARPMDFTGRPLTGFVYVAPAGFATGPGLAGWVARAARFAASLPAKRRARKRANRKGRGPLVDNGGRMTTTRRPPR